MSRGDDQPASAPDPEEKEPAPTPARQELPAAWQPLTPRGAAAFARASVARVFLAGFIIASLSAAAVVWFVASAWFPEIVAAIGQLPDTGTIRRQLPSSYTNAHVLAGGRFLSFAIDPKNESRASQSGDIQVEMHRMDWEACSFLGCWSFTYPEGWEIEFNQTALEPWWGAWSPFILAGLALSALVVLLVWWVLLATVYFIPVWIYAYFANRDLGLGGSWRLCAAGLMPGALLLALSLALYGLGVIGLLPFCFVAAFHVVLGWIYCLICPFCLPRVAPHLRGNPFARRPAG